LAGDPKPADVPAAYRAGKGRPGAGAALLDAEAAQEPQPPKHADRDAAILSEQAEGKTLWELAEKYGQTHQRISQIVNRRR
jgi:hypothetical protein